MKRFNYVYRDDDVPEAGRRWLAAGDVFAQRRGRVEASTQRPQRKSSPRNQRGNFTARVSHALVDNMARGLSRRTTASRALGDTPVVDYVPDASNEKRARY